ncbi:helix-turn-helix domain-containing protein, partial [Pseudomonas aeruginosa]|uniref:helix-turn-helix domain-containing protein n=1 Tax=Pseudomonas aeruginosa TaxID=287 RepID=UPI000FC3FF5B
MSRTKLSLSFKLQVVKHFLSTTDGQRKTGARFGIDQSHVRQWVNLYKQHGISGLYAVRHKYTAEEKERSIIYMRENELSAR